MRGEPPICWFQTSKAERRAWAGRCRETGWEERGSPAERPYGQHLLRRLPRSSELGTILLSHSLRGSWHLFGPNFQGPDSWSSHSHINFSYPSLSHRKGHVCFVCFVRPPGSRDPTFKQRHFSFSVNNIFSTNETPDLLTCQYFWLCALNRVLLWYFCEI